MCMRRAYVGMRTCTSMSAGSRSGMIPEITKRHDAQTNIIRLKSKKPKDKRPGSDQLLCFKTIIIHKKHNQSIKYKNFIL